MQSRICSARAVIVFFLLLIFEPCGLFFSLITQTICGCYISYSLLDTLFFFQPTQVIDDENVTNLDEDKYFVKLMTLSGMTVTTSDGKFMITMSDKKINK